MIKPQDHKNEKERLKALESYSILDSLSEVDYDNLTAIASEICDTPISLVSLIDKDRQWFKSNHGLSMNETPKDQAFCAHAINENDGMMLVQDARKDIRFIDNPLVTGEMKAVFYAGIVLKTEDNLPLGTLCVIDNKPKLLSQNQIKSLKALSNQVMNLLELRKNKLLLEKANEELEENNQELERFAFIAAHDLKSPLNNITSLANLLAEDYGTKIDSEGQQLIEYIKTSSEKLNDLIKGLLAYSKTSRLIKEERSEVNLVKLKDDMMGLYSFENKCQITLVTDLTSISINRTVIEQILINLIANSYKYCDKEIAEIELVFKEDETQYEIAVKDNGPGISKENQGKIFNIFETLSANDKFGDQGNGIGLATVKKLVETLGGKISVESEIGEGTTISFTIIK
jgi:signal transduction histidine kinase